MSGRLATHLIAVMENLTVRIFAAFFLLVATAKADPAATNQAQREITLKFPYYFTGTNKLGQAIYLAEYGKWDTQSVLNEGKSAELLDQFYTNFFTAMVQDGLSSGSNGTILIIDAKGLDASQTEDPAVVKFFMKQAAKFDAMNKDKAIKLVYVVNANKPFLNIFEAVKPSLKEAGNLFEIYTESVATWCTDLLSYLNLDVKTRSGVSGLPLLQILLNEEFPEDIRKKFPYSLSGYTADGSPIFIMPLGKYDYKSAVERGSDSSEQLSRLMSQMFLRLYASGMTAPSGRGAILIVDVKGLSSEQIETPDVRKHMLNDFVAMDKISSGPGLNKVYVINAPSAVYQKFHADVEPLLVDTGKRVQVFYDDQDQDYRSALREEVKTPIPEEYGGTSDYIPLVSY